MLFFAGVENEPDAGDDKGNAQELTHVKGHALLKIHLDLLEELDEETECKDGGDAESEEKSAAYLFLMLAVENKCNDKDDDVGYCLVQLGGMACKILAVLDKDKTPVGAGGLAHDFRVHKIAQTYACGSKRSGNAHHVNALQYLDLVLAAVEQHSYEYADGTAVAGQSAVSDHLKAAARQET